MAIVREQTSPRVRSVMRLFGIDRIAAAAPPEVGIHPLPGEITLITGPSGCGKTTALRALAARDERHILLRADTDDDPRAVVDRFALPLCDTLALLSRCGLSEAGVLLLPAAQLSQGQRYRYELARCMASPAPIVIADEFCSLLDRTAACVLCWQLRRLVGGSGKALVVATTHEDIAADLAPDHWLQMDLGGLARWQKGGGHVQHC